MLIGQLTHALDPTTAAYNPATQLVHTVEELAPTAIEYDPAEHPVHALALTTVEYDPAGQAMQFPVDPYVPGAQPADTHALDPAIDDLPASHAVHVVAPLFEYLLAGHWMHVSKGTVHLFLHSQQFGQAPSSTQ